MKIKKIENLFLKIGEIKFNIRKINKETLQLVDEDSILWSFGNYFSGWGQDQILKYLFRELWISIGYFEEFSAYDRITYSNKKNIYKKGFKVERFREFLPKLL